MILDDTAVHTVERAQVTHGRLAVQLVVVPRANPGDRPGGPQRLAAHGGDALGEFVGHGANGVVLWIQHLVDGDEVHADHVPMNVLEGQL